MLYDPLTGCEALAAADELRQLIDERTPPNHPLLHAPMLVVRAQARRQRRKRSHGAPPTEAYLCTGMDVYGRTNPVSCARWRCSTPGCAARFTGEGTEMGGLGSVGERARSHRRRTTGSARGASSRMRGLRVCVVLSWRVDGVNLRVLRSSVDVVGGCCDARRGPRASQRAQESARRRAALRAALCGPGLADGRVVGKSATQTAAAGAQAIARPGSAEACPTHQACPTRPGCPGESPRAPGTTNRCMPHQAPPRPARRRPRPLSSRHAARTPQSSARTGSRGTPRPCLIE